MGTIHKRHSAEFKGKVALEAIKENNTLNELASKYGVHQGQISLWKKLLLEALPDIFGKAKQSKAMDFTKKLDELHRIIGEVTVERDWLKKKLQILE